MELRFAAIAVIAFCKNFVGRTHGLEHLLQKDGFKFPCYFFQRLGIFIATQTFDVVQRTVIQKGILSCLHLLFCIERDHQITTSSAFRAPDCFSASRIAIKSAGDAPTVLTDLTISSRLAPGANLNMGLVSSVTSTRLLGTTTVCP